MKCLTLSHGLNNSISSGRSDLNNVNHPTEDKVIQVDMGSRDHPKPIFISESLSLTGREELISLIRDYINVFAWNYEDMLDLDSQIAMHRLNIKPNVKPVKQQQRRFTLTSWKLLKLKSINSSNVISYGRNNTRIGLLALSPFLKIMKNLNLY